MIGKLYFCAMLTPLNDVLRVIVDSHRTQLGSGRNWDEWVSIEIYPKCFHWIQWQKILYCKKIIQTCHLLCKRPRCCHSASKTQVAERIFILNRIHASVIYQILWICWISDPFRENSIILCRNVETGPCQRQEPGPLFLIGLVTFSVPLLTPVPCSVKIHSFNLLPFTAEPFVCGSNMTMDTGVIESHNYPNEYPGFSRCVWIVTAEENERITFQLLSINLQQCCSCDRIQIR